VYAVLAWEGLDEVQRGDHEVQWVGLWTFVYHLFTGVFLFWDNCDFNISICFVSLLAWEGLDEAGRVDCEVEWVGLCTFCVSLIHGVFLFCGFKETGTKMR
jgi:hypothetical protein